MLSIRIKKTNRYYSLRKKISRLKKASIDKKMNTLLEDVQQKTKSFRDHYFPDELKRNNRTFNEI
ncbi:hypothetical protein BEV13_05525 [Rickettsiella grylli]|uniref:Uncharacterized protein n=2 Tax=Rickettsiella grylli TaxID=59196 RepID=A8PLY7_9COXI|nr:conserved hypothetical protein [Rickettsiella grylli]OIZ99571.1 hypothetical protein BEV13_05525 [Rickettsiella grylli]